MKRLLIICIIASAFASCRAEYETVVQSQVVTDVEQNSRGTYRVRTRAVDDAAPLKSAKITRGDTLQYMVLRRIK